MKLNELSDRPGATTARKRVGRGIGSGLGKTGGRGVKGQKSRGGVAIKGFEGGQMPLHRRLPKRGFKSLSPKEYAIVNLDKLQEAVESGRLDASKPIDGDVLAAAGLVRAGTKDGVRVLGRGEIRTALDLNVAGASKTAVAAIEKAGGKVTLPAGAEASA